MKTITAKRPYQGSDPATGEEFRIVEGESREVSDEKAEQLERDFPDWFDFGSKAKGKKPAPKKNDDKSEKGAPAETGGGKSDPPPDYTALKQPALKKLLDDRKIEYPSGVVSNAALIELLEQDDAKASD